MSKRALSVTLDPANILWLRGRTRATGRRSVSETLDRLVSEARSGGKANSTIRSVVGNIWIDESDPDLARASDEVRALFRSSIDQSARALRSGRGIPRKGGGTRAR